MIKSSQEKRTRFMRCAVGSLVLATGFYGSVVLAQSTSPSENKDLSITVEAGDTFSSILLRELSSLEFQEEVAKHNALTQEDQILPGDVIVIPGQVVRLRNYATVVYVKGTVLHRNAAGETVELSKGDRIYSGDQVNTDEAGFVSMSFNGGSLVNIQPESAMKINVLECVDRDDACEIDLESGEGALGLDVKSVGFEKPTVFNIKTPFASAAVRGTRFDFDINDGNILGVTEGTVEIVFNGVRNSVGVGKGVLAGEGLSVNDIYDLLEGPQLVMRDDITRVSSQDIINWQPVDDASNYLLAFARSESMADVLVSTTETDTYIQPMLPAGEYFVGARAVANNGLRGFSTQKKLAVVDIDTKVDAAELDIIIADDEMQITAIADASDDVEIKIGNSLVVLDDGDRIVASEIRQIKGGETLMLQIDPKKDWYLQSRKIIDPSTVSEYGLLYFVEQTGG